MDIEDEKDNQTHLLPDLIKHSIVFLKIQREKTNKQIAKEVFRDFKRQIGNSTVQRVWQNFQERGDSSNQWSHQGRPNLLSEEDEQMLIDMVREDRLSSARELKEKLDFDVSRETVNRTLLKNGYKSYIAPAKPLLSEDNVHQRLQFAQAHRSWTENRWKTVIFTDESPFRLVNPNGRMVVRRLAEEQLDPDCFQAKVVRSDLVMVWGAISREGVGPLVRATGKIRAKEYLDFFRYSLRKYYPGLYNGSQIFQDDNAGVHTANMVDSWFTHYGITRIGWPAKSPDLNIIEDVWNKIKYEIRGRNFTSQDELWEEVKLQWKQISPEFIEQLYASLPARIQAVVEAQGGVTKY